MEKNEKKKMIWGHTTVTEKQAYNLKLAFRAIRWVNEALPGFFFPSCRTRHLCLWLPAGTPIHSDVQWALNSNSIRPGQAPA